MRIELMYTGCLSQGAYYIESKGEVAIIDPIREIKPYIEKSKENNASIKYIFETHFHVDFVSGHIPRSIFIGLDGGFAPWVGPLIGDVKQSILLITPKRRRNYHQTFQSRI